MRDRAFSVALADPARWRRLIRTSSPPVTRGRSTSPPGGAKNGEKMTKSRTGRYEALVRSAQRAASPGRIVGMGSASGRGLMRS